MVIVSVAATQGRAAWAVQVANSLLNQSVTPDKIIFWVSGAYPSIPGVEIMEVENIGPYRKLLPALKAFPNDIIVTADDDIIYPKDWLARLLESYRQYPQCIHFYRGRECIPGAPYRLWPLVHHGDRPSHSYYATGRDGVLYPPHVFDEQIHDVEMAMKLAPTNDDFWYKAMARAEYRQVPSDGLEFKEIDHDGLRLWDVNKYYNDLFLQRLGIKKASPRG